MAMDIMELNFGRYNSNQIAPQGSFVNLRTLSVVQQTTDGNMPPDGTYFRVGPLGTEAFATLAATINGVLGTSYTAASFHARTSSDAETSAGQASDDA